jgi:hypothetical protein
MRRLGKGERMNEEITVARLSRTNGAIRVQIGEKTYISPLIAASRVFMGMAVSTPLFLLEEEEAKK